MKILPIGDHHRRPGVSNKVTEAIGNYIVAARPDVIVEIGDWADMPSLSSYDRGKASAEGRRYKEDIDAANNALDALEAPLQALRAKQRRDHSTLYSPTKYKLIGNHEQRIERHTNANPELVGAIGYKDFKFASYGWEVVDFLEPLIVEGITFQHYFTSGILGKPIGGIHPAYSILTKCLSSCVQGHTHTRDVKDLTRANGSKIRAAVVGCSFDHSEDWCKTQSLWWRGLMPLKNCKDGYFDIEEEIGLDELKSRYGNEKP